MKKTIKMALLSLAAIVGVAVASLPLTRPTISTDPREMTVYQNVPFVVMAAFTNADKLFVYRGEPTYGRIYEFPLSENVKNSPDIHYGEYTDMLASDETYVELWFIVQGAEEGVSDFCITTCYAI